MGNVSGLIDLRFLSFLRTKNLVLIRYFYEATKFVQSSEFQFFHQKSGNLWIIFDWKAILTVQNSIRVKSMNGIKYLQRNVIYNNFLIKIKIVIHEKAVKRFFERQL